MFTFSFYFSESAIAQHFIETGKRKGSYSNIEYDPSDFSREAREAMVVVEPNSKSNAQATFGNVGTFDTEPTIAQIESYLIAKSSSLLADRRAKAEKLEADTIAQSLIVEQLEALSEEVLPESLEASDLKSWQCVKSLRDRLTALETRSAEIVKAREVAAKAAIKAERLAWINEHGSDHLKRATSGGYNCQRLYVEERAAIEYPELDLDYSDNLVSKDRSCPSVNALDELERYPSSRIVWVKERHDRSDDEYEYEDDAYGGEEAIVIENYLGSYTLVKYLGDPQD